MRRSTIQGLAVASGGSGRGPRVVLVHGGMDRGTAFLKATRHLRDVRWTVYDRRGYGRSLGAGVPPGVDGHVEDLAAVIGHEPAVVVGHSLGGTIALTAAARHPGLVRAVVTYEAPLLWMPWWPRRGAAEEGAIEDDPPEVAAERFMRRVVGDRVWEQLPERTRAQRRAEGAALTAEMASLRVGPPFRWADVVAPVVVGIGGGADEVRTRAAELLVAELPEAELAVVPDAPHGAHLARPEAFAALVRRGVTLATGEG